MLYTTTFFLSVLAHYVMALPITNNGFEIDDYPIPNNTYRIFNYTATGWTQYDPNNVMSDSSVRIQNPLGSDSFNDATFGSASPEGLQILSLQPQGEGEKNGEGKERVLGIEQELPGTIIEVNTTYILTAYIGNPDNNCFSVLSTDGAVCTNDLYTGFPGYKTELLANDTVIAEDDNTLQIPEQTWALSAAQAIILPGDPNIAAGPLKIRLIHKNIAKSMGFQVTFDDIQLIAVTATPISVSTAIPQESTIFTSTVATTSNIRPNPSEQSTVSSSSTDSNTAASTLYESTEEGVYSNEGKVHEMTQMSTTQHGYLDNEDSVKQSNDELISHDFIFGLIGGAIMVTLCVAICFCGYKLKKHHVTAQQHMNATKRSSRLSNLSLQVIYSGKSANFKTNGKMNQNSLTEQLPAASPGFQKVGTHSYTNAQTYNSTPTEEHFAMALSNSVAIDNMLIDDAVDDMEALSFGASTADHLEEAEEGEINATSVEEIVQKEESDDDDDIELSDLGTNLKDIGMSDIEIIKDDAHDGEGDHAMLMDDIEDYVGTLE